MNALDYGLIHSVELQIKAFNLKCYEAIDYPINQAEWREYLKCEANEGSEDEDIYFEETRAWMYESGKLQR